MCHHQVVMTLHFLNNVANDAGSTQKLKIYVILASLKSETMGKLINRIPGPCLLISNYAYSALRTHVVCSTSLAMSTSLLKALPGTFGIKKHSHSIRYISACLTMSTSDLKALPCKLDIRRHSPSILYLPAESPRDWGVSEIFTHM